jgi:hypothetical protein
LGSAGVIASDAASLRHLSAYGLEASSMRSIGLVPM